MFTGFMGTTWIVASMVAVVAGAIGFFVVLRGSAFLAHAVPQGGFAGAAGASLLGVNTILGMGVFSVLAAWTIGWLGRRGRQDAAVALGLVMLLALGALFLSWNSQYEPQIFSLLFGEVLGISRSEIVPTALVSAVCLAAVVALYRSLLLDTALPQLAGLRRRRALVVETAFLTVVALATSLSLPVVGALLVFSLMIGPPAAARVVSANPLLALGLSVVFSTLTLWVSVAAAYWWNWPVGFFVGLLSAVWYVGARIGVAAHKHRADRVGRSALAVAAAP